jgi:hypothetical protein
MEGEYSRGPWNRQCIAREGDKYNNSKGIRDGGANLWTWLHIPLRDKQGINCRTTRRCANPCYKVQFERNGEASCKRRASPSPQIHAQIQCRATPCTCSNGDYPGIPHSLTLIPTHWLSSFGDFPYFCVTRRSIRVWEPRCLPSILCFYVIIYTVTSPAAHQSVPYISL